MKKWLEDNLTMSDCVILSILLLGLIALFWGAKEIATAALGSATTYVVKDKTRKTREEEVEVEKLRAEIQEERRKNDERLEKEVAAARAHALDSNLSDLVDRANRRVGGTD